MEEVDRTVHHMQDEASNFPDPNDRASQESEFSLELRTRDRERKLLRKITQGLKRLELNDYGWCESLRCGDWHPPTGGATYRHALHRLQNSRRDSRTPDRRMSAGGVPVRGRFAPTPSGPLHFGSLVAAMASRLDAHAHGGEWLLRIDDLDRNREAPDAREAILADLLALGFTWDGPVYNQRERAARYREAVDRLLAANAAFPCACSRRDVAAQSGDDKTIYPGTCRNGIAPGRTAHSVRLRVSDDVLEFNDEWAGCVRQHLMREVGDFVLWRGDDLASYHLATVLDDADAGVTRVVRGADLLDSTPRQIYLQGVLGLPTPVYAHLPLVLEGGRKLGKQTGAPRLDVRRPARTLVAALDFLRQSPPAALADAAVDEVWTWALANWRPAQLAHRS